MLNERDYMRNDGGARAMRQDSGPSAVKILIILNIIAFVFQKLNPAVTQNFALIASEVEMGQVYRLVTSMFLHGDFFHILFNMWGLYLFGSLLEQKLGKRDFFIMYFLSGLTGSAIWMVTNWGTSIPCIGASGAVFGVIISTAMFFPNVQLMLIFPPMPLKLKTFALVYILIEIYSELGSVTGSFMDNVAHVVHLGGALGGYLYIKIAYSKDIVWDFLPSFGGEKGGAYNSPQGWGYSDSSKKSSFTGTVSQNQLDTLLDKISKSGINSLSEAEMETLRTAREEMRNR